MKNKRIAAAMLAAVLASAAAAPLAGAYRADVPVSVTAKTTTKKKDTKDDSGKKKKKLYGWQTIDGKKYYYGKKGYPLKGWFRLKDGKQYYFDQDTGEMVTGFAVINKETYYFGKDGSMKIGFQTIDKKKYWFFNDGRMAKDMEKKINGKFYVFDKNGVIVSTMSSEGGSSVVAIDRLANRSNLSSGLSTTEWEEAYEKAYDIVKPLLGKSRDEQIKSIVGEVYSRIGNSVSVQDNFPHSNDPYGFFVDGVTTSVGTSKAVGLCLNMLGITYESVTGGWNESTWLRVKIGNDYYVVDGMNNCYEKEKKPYQHPYL